MEYKLIVAESPQAFDKFCIDAEKEGWNPTFALCMSMVVIENDEIVTNYAQQWMRTIPS